MEARFVSENMRFERGKDPKKAMGIGIINQREFPSMESFIEWLQAALPSILDTTKKDLKDRIKNLNRNEWSGTLPRFIFTGIVEWSRNQIKEENPKEEFIIGDKIFWDFRTLSGNGAFPRINGNAWPQMLLGKLQSAGILGSKPEPTFESVNFERGQDPRSSMGIGETAVIIDRIKELLRYDANNWGYEINSISIGDPNNFISFLMSDWGRNADPWCKNVLYQFGLLTDYIDLSIKPFLVSNGDGMVTVKFKFIERLNGRFKPTKMMALGSDPNKIIEIKE